MKPNSILPLIVAAALAGAVPILGSIVPRMSLEELANEAASIVDGVVENVESRWENRMIFSYVTIRIEESLKGRRSRTAVIRQVGGRIGNRVLDVPGMPAFTTGDRVVVFLKPNGNGTFHVVGMAQGRFRVLGDRALAHLGGSELPGPRSRPPGLATTVSIGVDDLKARIRGIVR